MKAEEIEEERERERERERDPSLLATGDEGASARKGIYREKCEYYLHKVLIN
jgi:hypothetical protein